MTNTPMTFEEWYAKNFANTNDPYHKRGFENAWQASQAQQVQVIAELKEDLLDLRTQVNYRCADVQRLTELNVELVEALEDARQTIRAWHGPMEWNIYDKHSPEMKRLNGAIAKVKGK